MVSNIWTINFIIIFIYFSSMEFFEAPVKLQIIKKISDTSSSTSSQENGEPET